MSKLLNADDTTSGESLIEQGQRIYEERLRDHIEQENKGRFVVIEPASGRYFLGDTGASALIAARAAMPDSLFCLIRIGHKAAHRISGHASRIR